MILRTIGKLFLAAFRWKPEGEPPRTGSYVLIAAPHTSNWDFPFTIALAWTYGVKIKWLGKHTLFRFPFGWFMKALGGIPVRRDRRNNLVQASADLLNDWDARGKQLTLLVPAEGTRARTEFWKSGFFHIARAAEVPVVLGYLDFARRRGGFGPAVGATEDASTMMDEVRSFYADKSAKHPEKFGPVRIKEEFADVASATVEPEALRAVGS